MSKVARTPSRRKPKRARTPEELEIKDTLASIQEDQEAGAGLDSDCVIRHMLAHKIRLTQKNYLELCYWGSKPTVKDLSFEEAGELPGSFFAWPVDKHSTN